MSNNTKDGRIKLSFNDKKYDEHQAKGIRAMELWETIKTEFKIIDIEPNANDVLLNENVFDYALKEYWEITKDQFPESVSSIKAIGLTDFNSEKVTRATAELKTLNKFFVVEKNEIYSSVEMDNYWIYVTENKESEFLKITKLITDVEAVATAAGWCWNFQKTLGTNRITVINGLCKVDEYYYSH
jgi:hypothetical protein